MKIKNKIGENEKRRFFNKKASIAYFQISILTVAIFAFAFLIVSVNEMEIVSAAQFKSFKTPQGEINGLNLRWVQDTTVAGHWEVSRFGYSWLRPNEASTERLTDWFRPKGYVFTDSQKKIIQTLAKNEENLNAFERTNYNGHPAIQDIETSRDESMAKFFVPTTNTASNVETPRQLPLNTDGQGLVNTAERRMGAVTVLASGGGLWGSGITDGMKFKTPDGSIVSVILDKNAARYSLKDSSGKIIEEFEGDPSELLTHGYTKISDSVSPPGAPPEENKNNSEGGIMDTLFGAKEGIMGNLIQGAVWAGTVYGLVKLLGGAVTKDKVAVDAAATALAGGIFAGKLTYGLLTTKTAMTAKGAAATAGKGTKVLGWMSQHATGVSVAVGLGVAIAIFLIMYKKKSTKVVTFECQPWSAPLGGEDCEKCNDELHACSEYRCKSLGQACSIVNVGTEEESCVWLNPYDVSSPTIKPWEDALTVGFKYTEVKERPPGTGMRIIKEGGKCIPSFHPMQFGITTNKPAQCKIDYNHTNTFDDMQYYVGETNLFSYNHSQRLNLPGPNATMQQVPEIENDGTYTLYIRCMDANGNVNEDEYAIRFCVDKGPDTTPPLIIATSIENGMPTYYNADNIPFEIYVNEPAECKWSREDKKYQDMENSMECATNIWEMSDDLTYTCTTQLTGIKNKEDNYFYFRCKDQPWLQDNDRNVNAISYKFVLKGTQPLNILSVKPNGTIRGATSTVTVELEVETANGYEDGEAECYYSTTGKEGEYLAFYETGIGRGTNIHKQKQDLTAGTYTYFVKCVDLGGNQDSNKTTFKLEIDKQAPRVVRVYNDKDSLKLITDEDADCTYSSTTCNFNFADGKEMIHESSSRAKESFAEWDVKQTYYIKCKDIYNNEPLPTSCSIIVKPYQLLAGTSEGETYS